MPICFAQGIANSETVCAIFTEQKPNDWEAQSKLFATGAMSNRLCVRDLFAENKHRGQCGQTIVIVQCIYNDVLFYEVNFIPCTIAYPFDEYQVVAIDDREVGGGSGRRES